MNKTIINGIDVSECKNFSCGICEEENKIPRTIEHFTADCIFYPNCYYKQLKRLQQELDIKEKMLDKFMIGSGEILKKLQEENERLKKYQYTQKYLQSEIEKRQQALEQIREIVSDEIDKTDADDELMQIYGTIYNRCKEVLNDRD